MIPVLEFFVEGLPAQQGSKTAGVTKDGRPYLRDANSNALKAWRKQVAKAAAYQAESFEAAWTKGVVLERETPVAVGIEFFMERGKTVTREFPTTKPDLDKLIRAVFDGIGDAKNVWADDCQVVGLDRVEENYAEEGEKVGALVRVGIRESRRK